MRQRPPKPINMDVINRVMGNSPYTKHDGDVFDVLNAKKVIGYNKSKPDSYVMMYLVRFRSSGWSTWSRAVDIEKLKVYHPYHMSKRHGGMTGQFKTQAGDENKFIEHSIWRSMRGRCMDPQHPEYYKYGGRGVTVCDRWQLYENFVLDLPSLPGYDNWYKYGSHLYQLDKDIRQLHLPMHQRIYSPFTCCFISSRLNTTTNISDEAETIFPGIKETPVHHFSVRINDICFGTYKNVEAAVAMRNYVMRRIGIFDSIIPGSEYVLSENAMMANMVITNNRDPFANMSLEEKIEKVRSFNCGPNTDVHIDLNSIENKRTMCIDVSGIFNPTYEEFHKQ